MRQRGANATDIVVLVVSAMCGVQPQTLEVVKYARAAQVCHLKDTPQSNVKKYKLYAGSKPQIYWVTTSGWNDLAYAPGSYCGGNQQVRPPRGEAFQGDGGSCRYAITDVA